MYTILDPITGMGTIFFETEEEAQEILQYALPGASIVKLPTEDDLYDVLY